MSSPGLPVRFHNFLSSVLSSLKLRLVGWIERIETQHNRLLQIQLLISIVKFHQGTRRIMNNSYKSVMFVIADDWSRIAKCYGNDVIRTPNIDAFAERGVVFDYAFCTSPSCAVSRACILTGQHSHTHGQYGPLPRVFTDFVHTSICNRCQKF